MQAQQVMQAMLACGSHDNSTRKAGEAALTSVRRQKDYIPLLLYVSGANNAALQVRQLALSELRKTVIQDGAASPQDRAKIRQALQIVLEDSGCPSSIQRAAVDALGATAKQALPAGEWPDFLPWLSKAAESTNASHREHSIKLLGSLLSYLGSNMTQHLPELLLICKKGMFDPEQKVQAASLTMFGTCIGFIEDETLAKPVLDVLPTLFKTLQSAIANGALESVREGFDSLLDLVEAPIPIPSNYLFELIQWDLLVSAQQNDSEDFQLVRSHALALLESLGMSKPKQFAKSGLVKQTAATLCQVIKEPSNLEPSSTLSDISLSAVAAQTLDSLAKVLPSSQLFPEAMRHAQAGIKSQLGNERRGACEILTMILEGCSKSARKHIEAILEVISIGVQDQDALVRSAGAFALGHLAEHCQPEVIAHTTRILPVVFSLLKDANESVQDQAGYALQALCENLEGDPKVGDYLEQLMSSLGEILQLDGLQSKLAALKAIAYTAEAAGPKFLFFAHKLVPVLHEYMHITEGEMLECRGAATECMGALFSAVGFDALQQSFPQTMHLALQGFELDVNELRESTHLALTQIASSSADKFSPWVVQAVQAGVRSVEADDGGLKSVPGDKASPAKSIELNSEDSSEEDIDDDEDRFDLHTAIHEEKAAAIQALATYATACPLAFAPFIPSTLELMCKMADYFNEAIREESYKALGSLIKACKILHPPNSDGDYPDFVQALAKVGVQKLLEACTEDDSADAVSAAMDSLTLYMEGLKWDVDITDLTAVIIKLVLSGNLLCQEVVSDFEDWEDSDIKDNKDVALIHSACDLIPVLIRQSPKERQAWCTSHWQLLHPLLKPKKPGMVRAAVLALAAEVVTELGSSTPRQEASQLLSVVKRELSCEEEDNRRHAAYALGCIAQALPELVQSQQDMFLQALVPLMSLKEANAVVDNALGALARMTSSLPLATFPLEQVIGPMMAALPLREDFEEADPIYSCLMMLAADPGLRDRLHSSLHLIGTTLQRGLEEDRVPAVVKTKISAFLAASKG